MHPQREVLAQIFWNGESNYILLLQEMLHFFSKRNIYFCLQCNYKRMWIVNKKKRINPSFAHIFLFSKWKIGSYWQYAVCRFPNKIGKYMISIPCRIDKIYRKDELPSSTDKIQIKWNPQVTILLFMDILQKMWQSVLIRRSIPFSLNPMSLNWMKAKIFVQRNRNGASNQQT